jgi:diguanylate cyclase (GGDEF)-like protein/PAS domain S-box-containing protein
MHYTAMAAAHFHTHSFSFAALANGIKNSNLFYAVVCSNLLLMLLLLFALLADNKVVLWKVLLIVGVSESTIMLVMPIILPTNIPETWKTLFDVSFLLIFVSPVAWRLKVTAESLLSNGHALQRNLEAQQTTNQLLSLSIHQLDMEELLNKALKIVLKLSWLKIAPKGVIFLNHAEDKILTMATQHNVYTNHSDTCLQVAYDYCVCGQAANCLKAQYHLADINAALSLNYHEGSMDYGHYVIPLSSNQTLLGVLCLYLEPEQALSSSEINTLKTFANTIAELIRFKQALEEVSLADTVFKHNLACLLITDANKKILSVNPVFTEITGYSLADVIGKTPAILSSGKHSAEFYNGMWQTLAETGRWKGEIWNKRKNGDFYLEWLTIIAVYDHKGRVKNYIGVFDDISLHKEHEERINQLAFFDALTGLTNRTLFYEKLEQAIAQAKEHQSKLALLFIDLDRFKDVNDTLGHNAGDELLKTVALRISSCLRPTDTLARLGGDEFVVILDNINQTDADIILQVCEKTAKSIISSLSESHTYKDYTFYGGASIGIVIYPDDAHSINDLIQLADTAMYEAKNSGRNTYRFFSSDMIDAIKMRITMIHKLKNAIENSELYLTYQPLVDMKNKSIIGAEVLLRWKNPELGLVSPVDFIPLAEDTGLILSIGEWVIEQACLQINLWAINKPANLHYLAINVSIHQLIHPNFVEKLVNICEKTGVSSDKLELEITESALAQYPDNVNDILNRLSNLGYKLAIDDFGTDYSSLSRLKSFNVDLLKIDRSFVCDMINNKDDAAITRAVIDLAKALSLTTLAEGVESQAQFEMLKKFGCERAQGYLFGKPMIASEFESYCTQQIPCDDLYNDFVI